MIVGVRIVDYLSGFIFNCFVIEICFFNGNDDGLIELAVEVLLRFIFIDVWPRK